MTRCEMCGYYWIDRDDDGESYGRPYCHYDGPPMWAPCEQDDNGKTDDYDGYYGEEDG